MKDQDYAMSQRFRRALIRATEPLVRDGLHIAIVQFCRWRIDYDDNDEFDSDRFKRLCLPDVV